MYVDHIHPSFLAPPKHPHLDTPKLHVLVYMCVYVHLIIHQLLHVLFIYPSRCGAIHESVTFVFGKSFKPKVY